MKPHFKKRNGYWESHYFRRGLATHLPITRGKTLTGCVEKLMMYKPELLKEATHELA